MKSILIAAGLLTTAVCACAEKPAPKRADTAGICFRFIEAVTPEGEITRRREVVLVQPSSRPDLDLARLRMLEEESTFSFSPGHTRTNVWFGGWISEGMADFSKGPDCSRLPGLPPIAKD